MASPKIIGYQDMVSNQNLAGSDSGSDQDDGSSAALAALFAGLVAAGANVYSTYKTNKTQRELADEAYQRELEMVNLQNQYNSESSKMQRLADAGLNPLLVYGGSTSASNQSELPRYHAPSLKAPEFDVNQAMNIVQVLSALKTQEAQRRLISAQADTQEQQANYIWSRNVLSQNQINYWALLTGQRPADMSNDQDYYNLLNSPVAKKYSSEYATRIAQKELFDSQKALNRLTYDDRKKYLSETLAARIKVQILEAQGMDHEVAMKRVERDWQEKLIKRGYNTQLWNTIFRGVGAASGLVGGAGIFLRGFMPRTQSREFFGPGGDITGGYIDNYYGW